MSRAAILRTSRGARLLVLAGALAATGVGEPRSEPASAGQRKVVRMSASQTNGSAEARAEVAGSRRGDARARMALMQRIEAGAVADLRYLLTVLDEVDDPKVLHHLANRTLDDERPLEGDAGRRICDAAVEAFVHRLKLAAPKPAAGRYGPEARAAVREAMRGTLPM